MSEEQPTATGWQLATLRELAQDADLMALFTAGNLVVRISPGVFIRDITPTSAGTFILHFHHQTPHFDFGGEFMDDARGDGQVEYAHASVEDLKVWIEAQWRKAVDADRKKPKGRE